MATPYSSKDDIPKISQDFSFSLHACAKEVVKLFTPHLDMLGLTYPQYLVMLVLWEKKQTTVKGLGEQLYLNSATLTPLLKKLEAKGFVTRQRLKSDERNVLIHITSEGEALREDASGISRDVVKSLRLEPNEEKVIFILMHKILTRISPMDQDG